MTFYQRDGQKVIIFSRPIFKVKEVEIDKLLKHISDPLFYMCNKMENSLKPQVEMSHVKGLN